MNLVILIRLMIHESLLFRFNSFKIIGHLHICILLDSCLRIENRFIERIGKWKNFQRKPKLPIPREGASLSLGLTQFKQNTYP